MECKIKKIIQKACSDRKVVLGITFLFVVVAVIYHYSLRLGFIPNGEDVSAPFSMYRMSKYADKVSFNNLWDILAFAVFKMCGVTYTAVRLTFTVWYLILLLLMLLLVYKKDEKDYLFILPLFALFMVLLRPVGGFDHWGWLGGDDLIIQWGYDYHYDARVTAMLGVVLLQFILKNRKSKLLKVFLVCSIVYGFHLRDLTYFVMFIAPLLVIYIFRWIRVEKTKEMFIWVVIVGIGFVLLSRILPGDFFERLWSKEPTSQYGYIYGGTNWSDITGFPQRFFQYVKLILQFFNVRLGKLPLISAYTVVYMIKIGLIIFGYIHIFRIAVTTIKGNGEKYGYDEIDGILAWSFILLTIVYLFTDLGGATFSIRYMSGLVSSMTLILCRNIKNINGIIDQKWIANVKYKKVAFVVTLTFMCFCYVEKTWKFEASDSYVKDFEAAIDYIRNNGGGYGLGRSWAAGRVAAMTGGEIEFYGSLDDLRFVHGEDAIVTYMIVNFDSGLGKEEWLFFDNFADYWDLCEKYSEPSEVIGYEHFNLLVWEDGIRVRD